MNIFKNFKTDKKLIENSKFVKVYSCLSDGKNYNIVITKKRANRFSIIHCVDDTIVWEQIPHFYRLAGKFPGEGDRLPIFKAKLQNNETLIFVVKGKPNGIVGIDDGIFRSVYKYDDSFANVLTYNQFKKI